MKTDQFSTAIKRDNHPPVIGFAEAEVSERFLLVSPVEKIFRRCHRKGLVQFEFGFLGFIPDYAGQINHFHSVEVIHTESPSKQSYGAPLRIARETMKHPEFRGQKKRLSTTAVGVVLPERTHAPYLSIGHPYGVVVLQYFEKLGHRFVLRLSITSLRRSTESVADFTFVPLTPSAVLCVCINVPSGTSDFLSSVIAFIK